MQAAQKKRLEEKNAKLIRELAALPPNRNCFECGQRGPTYVNITEGSFCCTQCSGILRGLNPPHRVKSISMASFTTEDVEKLRGLGNAENAKIWLALYNGSPPAMINRDAIQAFLVKKYEQKTWYVSRSELSEQERLMNQARETVSRTSHETGSITSGSTSKPSDLDLLSSDPFSLLPAASSSQPVAGNSQTSSGNQAFSPPAWLAPPPPFSFDALPQKVATPATAPSADLFGLAFGTNPPTTNGSTLPPFPTVSAPPPTFNDPFADFDKKFSDLTVRPSNTVSAFNGLTQLTAPVMPKSATVDSGMSCLLQPVAANSNPFQVNSAPLQPAPVSTSPSTVSETSAPSIQAPAGDKYSALAELDELFHHSGTSHTGDVGAGGKPSWMPTGFSTGIPPSATTGSLQTNGTPRQQPQQVQQQPSAMNGFGSFPKSQTIGGLSDLGVNNPFLTNTQNFTQGSFPNLFGPPLPSNQPAAAALLQNQQPWGLAQQPIIPPRPQPTMTTSYAPPTGAAAPNWNPFL